MILLLGPTKSLVGQYLFRGVDQHLVPQGKKHPCCVRARVKKPCPATLPSDVTTPEAWLCGLDRQIQNLNSRDRNEAARCTAVLATRSLRDDEHTKSSDNQ